jgi:hypothetical protein
MRDGAEKAHELSPGALPQWSRCTCPPDPAQLALFEPQTLDVPPSWDWPLIETSCCRRIGFWWRRTPAVFGRRRGVGPLIICPDTNILISLYENLDAAEEGIGLIGGPLVASEWPTTVDALRDLVGVWWWRDIRFWVDRELHLGDGRAVIRPDRFRAREIAIEQLSQDFFERGSWDRHPPDDLQADDPVCVLHPDAAGSPCPAARPAPRWPSRSLDRGLVEAALNAGCHVFLTEDRDILKCHATLREHGLAVLRPSQALEALDAVGELEPVRSALDPAPDLSTLARL